MRRGRRFPICFFLLAALTGLVLPGAGCGDAVSSEVKELLAEVNVHLEKSASAVKKLEEFEEQWDALASSPQVTEETVAEATALLEVVQKNITTALQEVKEARKVLLTIKEMRVSKEMKKYVDMKLDALSEQEKMLELELRAMVIRNLALSEPESGELVEHLMGYDKQISELEEEAREIAARAQALHLEANDYYDEKIGK